VFVTDAGRLSVVGLDRQGVLGNFTDQGIRSVRDSLKREDAFRKQCEKIGAQVKDVYRNGPMT
jgi:uncharacterized protein with GYD domain